MDHIYGIAVRNLPDELLVIKVKAVGADQQGRPRTKEVEVRCLGIPPRPGARVHAMRVDGEYRVVTWS